MDSYTKPLALRRYLLVVQRWLWLIVLATLLAASGAFLASRLSPRIYEASTVLLISEGQRATGPDYNALLVSERLARTYTQLLKGAPVLDEVRAQLKLAMSDAEMDRMISVDPVRDTQLVRLKVRHQDPDLAARIANAAPQTLIKQNENMQSQRLASSKQNLSREMTRLQSEMDQTQRDLEAERAKNPGAAEVARLEALLAQYRSTYAGLLQSYEEIRVAEANGSNTMVVVEPAKVPERPVLPKTFTNTLVAAALGALIGLGSAFFIEYLDDTIKSSEDVERAVRLPTLASILDDGQRGLPALGNSPTVEGYRELRTNLQFAALGRRGPARMFLVTSAQPLEGKTTILANLGVSLAQTGKQVLLVDTDLRQPALHQLFNLSNWVGLTSLLLGKADLETATQTTRVKGLQVLAAGPVPANPAELLDSPGMADLLEQLRGRADYCLLDAPPVLSVTDALTLAQKVDGVVLVAESGRTRADSVWHAVASLARVRARILGVVLNKVKTRSGVYGYSSYHAHKEPWTDKRHGMDPPRPRWIGRAWGRLLSQRLAPYGGGQERAPASLLSKRVPRRKD